MTLLLMLCCGGCAIGRQPVVASVSTGPLGNSVLVTLPAGTLLQPPSKTDTEQLQSLFSGYLAPLPPMPGSSPAPALRVVRPLKLATPSYLAERDAAELQLHRTIEAQRLTK